MSQKTNGKAMTNGKAASEANGKAAIKANGQNDSTQKKWTIMVYLSGDNNLSDEMVWSLKEMHRVGARKDFDVVVWFDPGGISSGPFKYEIRTVEDDMQNSEKIQRFQDGILDQISRNLITPLNGNGKNGLESFEDSADPNVLKSFVTSSIRDHPAEFYALILSGHGNGWRGDFLTDDNPHSSLSIADLARALSEALDDLKEEGIKASINVLGMDSCLMSNMEVCSQLQEVEGIEYLVGSEGFELATGWPYHRILNKLRKKLGRGVVDPKDLAKEIVDRHFYYYLDYVISGISTDLSAISLKSNVFKSVLASTERLARELRGGLSEDAVKSAISIAHLEAQAYKTSDYVDLWDFADRLIEQCNARMGSNSDGHPARQDAGVPGTSQQPDDSRWASIREKAEDLKRAIDRAVVASEYTGGAFQHSHGISVYFPWSTYLSEYDRLAFSFETGWNDFLRDYVRETRRKVRDDKYNESNGILLPTYEFVVASKTGTADQVKAGRMNSFRTGTADQVKTGTADQAKNAGKGASTAPGNPPRYFWHKQEGKLTEVRRIAESIIKRIIEIISSGHPPSRKEIEELEELGKRFPHYKALVDPVVNAASAGSEGLDVT